jgi:peptidoglycan/xylan/chitin deacetylase (PgdA/CDA1 family)
MPMISFTFDDFPRSALTVGGRMLTDHGWRGTYYGAMGLMGRTTSAGPMFTRVDLDDLLRAGHELACHTFDHTSCLSVSTGRFVDGCADNRRMAATMLSGYQLQHFSFPHGHVTLAAKHALRSAYDTCRSTEWGINSDPVDLGFLRANPLYSRFAIGTVKQLICANSRANGWLVLYTHDVAVNPSPYGCTPEYFEEVLVCALESGADVLTIRDAAGRYQLCGLAASRVSNGEPYSDA